MEERRRQRAILGLKEGYTPTQLKQAYRDLAKVWHPDRFAGDPRLGKKAARQLSRINQAYRYLKEHPLPSPSEPQPNASKAREAPPRPPSSPPRPPTTGGETGRPARGEVIEGVTPLALRALRADSDARAGRISAFIGLCIVAAALPILAVLHTTDASAKATAKYDLVVAITAAVAVLGCVITMVSVFIRLRAKTWVLRELHEHDIPCPNCGVGIIAGVDAHRDSMTHIRHVQLRLLATVDSGRCMVCGKTWRAA